MVPTTMQYEILKGLSYYTILYSAKMIKEIGEELPNIFMVVYLVKPHILMFIVQ